MRNLLLLTPEGNLELLDGDSMSFGVTINIGRSNSGPIDSTQLRSRPGAALLRRLAWARIPNSVINHNVPFVGSAGSWYTLCCAIICAPRWVLIHKQEDTSGCYLILIKQTLLICWHVRLADVCLPDPGASARFPHMQLCFNYDILWTDLDIDYIAWQSLPSPLQSLPQNWTLAI